MRQRLPLEHRVPELRPRVSLAFSRNPREQQVELRRLNVLAQNVLVETDFPVEDFVRKVLEVVVEGVEQSARVFLDRVDVFFAEAEQVEEVGALPDDVWVVFGKLY